MKKSGAGKQYIQLLSDEEIEKRRKESLVLEIEHLDNDNFKIIVDGKKLRENFKKKIFTIDLLKQEKNLTLKLILLLHFASSFPERLRIMFRKQELAELERALEAGDNNALKSFIKKRGSGFKDIQEPFIIDYLDGLAAAYKNSETPKEDSKDIKKKLISALITPLTDKRGAEYIEVPEEKFKNDYKSITQKAENVYRSLKQFCKDSDCTIKNYVKCKKRFKCEYLSDYIESNLSIKAAKDKSYYLHYNCASKYRDAKMCKLYNKSIKDLYYIKRDLEI
jgi:hypothetical protein